MEESEKQLSVDWVKFSKIAVGLFLGYSFWFCLLVLMLRWVNPPFTAFTLQEDWDALGQERYSLRENWVTDKKIPGHMKLAVVASEDQRFYEHWGLDMLAIEEALQENERRSRTRGASTITQQVAKNLFLTPAQNYFRKGLEAGIAVLLEFFWTKDRILEVYLNIAEFGPGTYGIGKAPEYWFGKKVEDINPWESARLVTVLPNPKLIKAEPVSKYVQNRSYWILRNMQQLSGVRYLPKPAPDTTDTLPTLELLPDSLLAINPSDSMEMEIPDLDLSMPMPQSGSLMREAELDSLLLEIELDSTPMETELDSIDR